MTCPSLARLGCSQVGVGFLSRAWTPSSTSLDLQSGQGASFPQPSNGQVFWVDIGGCGCCVRLQVTARAGDVLTVVPPVSSDCACITATARVSYATNSAEHVQTLAAELPINVVPPLRWNCETRTLSIDCAALKDMVNTPCGT